MSAEAGAVLAVCEPGSDPEGTLATAGLLSLSMKAPLIAFSAIDPPSELAALAAAVGLSEAHAVDRLVAEARDRLEAALHANPGPRPTVEVVTGRAFLAIVRRALVGDIAFVVKTVDEHRGGGPILASTDQHLLRKCPATLWLRRPGDPPAPHRIAAAIDVGDPEEAALNERIVETALRLTALGGAPLHAVHAWQAHGEALVRRWADGPDGAVAADRYIQSLRVRHGDALRAALGENHHHVTPELVEGAPNDAVPRVIERLGADLLVMGTVGRTGIPGVIIGNTAEDILNATSCPIVTVKPPGYVSPIAP
ncbi:MAG: universal stress protein [Pseudomonadota bacterium]